MELRAWIVTLIGGLLLAACASGSGPDSCAAGPDRPVRFLALGDSYTIGEGVVEGDRWPVQLGALLEAEGIDTAPPEIIARTGWTTGDLTRGIASAGPQGPYDLVSLLIGVNNQYRGLSLSAYREEFAALLAQAVELAGGDPQRVIVLSIPDWGVTPFASRLDRGQIRAEIDAFNSVNREEAERLGVHYIDITPTTREAGDDLTLLAADRLHPSGKLYAEWARLTLPAACTALEAE